MQVQGPATLCLGDFVSERVGWKFTVVTADRGRLDFWPATDDVSNVTDVFGNRWQIRGSLTAIDASVDDQNRITYGDYPNALERIASSFDDRRTGTLWVTAKLGHAFRLPKTSVHERGGSHGSLHRLDSTVPLIVSAPSEAVCLGEHLRTVDVAALCQQLLGQTPAIPLGAGRFTETLRSILDPD